MDITAVRSADFGTGYGNTQVSGDNSSSGGLAVAFSPVTTDNGIAKESADTESTDKSQRQPKKEVVQDVANKLNDFMESMDTDIRFQIHDKTKRLVVQIVDAKDNRVIKQYPPREFLDTIAAIRDYIGMILDKKA